MKITLKVHKTSAMLSCVSYILCMFLIMVFLFLGTYSYWVSILCLFIFIVLCIMLRNILRKLSKGYVACLSPEGITLPSNRFIAWDTIDAISEIHISRYHPYSLLINVKPQPTKNILVKVLNKTIYGVIMLDNFEIGVREAYKLFVVCWTQYR